MAEEYPKLVYNPDDDSKFQTAYHREQEIDILAGWGLELPVIPLSGGKAAADQDGNADVDALHAQIADLEAAAEKQAAKATAAQDKAAEKHSKAEKAAAAANKRANDAEAKLAAAQKIIASMTKVPEPAPAQPGGNS